ncbi:uncharacterized protein LOC131220832 [Magnolia sinica]|uniref:uncharacterized protein LOC131220832 n=1 Tax=Magnolia sinica TaxID=86752 RepID=UPI00265B550C|nr:uncharacterized protein LOC131220832 [Magnolia sinica]
MEGHDASKYSRGVARARPLVGESADMKLAQKMMSEMLVIVIVVAAVGIVTGLPVGLPYHEFLSTAYAAANFTIFTLGMGLLVLFILFPQVPLSVFVAKKLVGVAAGLDQLSLSLKSKFITMRAAGARPSVGEAQNGMFMVPFLVIMAAAIGIVSDLPVGFPHHETLSIAYAVANFITFTLGMAFLFLYILFPQVPVSFVVAAGTPPWDAPPWDGELVDVKPVQKRMFKVSFLAITIASIVIVADLPVNLPHHELLSIVYTLAIFATFAFSVVLILLSILFPPLPILVVVAKKLIWVALGLVYLSLGLGMAIHAIS